MALPKDFGSKYIAIDKPESLFTQMLTQEERKEQVELMRTAFEVLKRLKFAFNPSGLIAAYQGISGRVIEDFDQGLSAEADNNPSSIKEIRAFNKILVDDFGVAYEQILTENEVSESPISTDEKLACVTTLEMITGEDYMFFPITLKLEFIKQLAPQSV